MYDCYDPRMDDVTQQECPEAPGAPGDDNRTHHLAPKGGEMRCVYCGKSREELARAS
jgi:hypothetical protein